MFEETGLGLPSIKRGLESAENHGLIGKISNNKYVLKTSVIEEINLDKQNIESVTRSKKEIPPKDGIYQKLIDGIYRITGKAWIEGREFNAAKDLSKLIREGVFSEQDVLDCLEWAKDNRFDVWSPSLISVRKLMPQYLKLKTDNKLENKQYESREEKRSRLLKDRDYETGS
jgi:hypothetical protein